MPVSYFSSAPDIRPRIIPSEVDPVEQQIRQAQLQNLLLDPKFKERALTLQQLGLEHTKENDDAIRRIQEAGLLENVRHNKAGEQYQTGVLGETTRHNLNEEDVARGSLAETGSYHAGLLEEGKARTEGALTQTLLSSLLATGGTAGNALAARTLALRGAPEFETALSQTAKKPTDVSALFADQGKAKPKTGNPLVDSPGLTGIIAGLAGPLGLGYIGLKASELKKKRNLSSLIAP